MGWYRASRAALLLFLLLVFILLICLILLLLFHSGNFIKDKLRSETYSIAQDTSIQ
jgi:maltodextrin utilization protein YvdJ